MNMMGALKIIAQEQHSLLYQTTPLYLDDSTSIVGIVSSAPKLGVYSRVLQTTCFTLVFLVASATARACSDSFYNFTWTNQTQTTIKNAYLGQLSFWTHALPEVCHGEHTIRACKDSLQGFSIIQVGLLNGDIWVRRQSFGFFALGVSRYRNNIELRSLRKRAKKATALSTCGPKDHNRLRFLGAYTAARHDFCC
jgi:hypothetical protein